MQTTLTISHNLFLTNEEREALLEPDGFVSVIGVSVPVWVCGDITSEPAIEVYAKYLLINSNTTYVKHNKEGYEITIQPNSVKVEPLPDDIWNSLSKEDQIQWWDLRKPEPSLEMLKTLKDGGSEWLAFRQYNKVKLRKKLLSVVHYVEIKMMPELIRSLI